jgi:hypothetical protein
VLDNGLARVEEVREQDAEEVRQRKKTVIWFVWPVSIVWLNKTNQMTKLTRKSNQIDQRNQTDQMDRACLKGLTIIHFSSMLIY